MKRARPKLRNAVSPSGNPYLRRLTDVEAAVKTHETRLTAVERGLHDISRDQALLGNMVIRCLERSRRWAPPRSRRR